MNSRCVILVPANSAIERTCEKSARELGLRGYPVWRVGGYAAVDQARNQMATDALAQGFDELFWIDSDIEFQPDAVEKLRAHNLPIVAGIYPKKGVRALAAHVIPGTKQILFGQGGGLVEILYAGTGFLLTRRQVYEDIQRLWSLPTCNRQFGGAGMTPYFMPIIVEDQNACRAEIRNSESGIRDDIHASTDASEVPHFEFPIPNSSFRHPWYLAEDFAFCYRARAAGYKIMAETTVRLGHIGRHSFQWEEAGISQQRLATFSYHFSEAPKKQ